MLVGGQVATVHVFKNQGMICSIRSLNYITTKSWCYTALFKFLPALTILIQYLYPTKWFS